MKNSLFWRLFFPVISIVIVFPVLVSRYVPGPFRGYAERDSIKSAERTINQFKAISNCYTKVVVAKVICRAASNLVAATYLAGRRILTWNWKTGRFILCLDY